MAATQHRDISGGIKAVTKLNSKQSMSSVQQCDYYKICHHMQNQTAKNVAKKLEKESKTEIKLQCCELIRPSCQLGDLFLNKLAAGQINRCFVQITGCVSESLCVSVCEGVG